MTEFIIQSNIFLFWKMYAAVRYFWCFNLFVLTSAKNNPFLFCQNTTRRPISTVNFWRCLSFRGMLVSVFVFVSSLMNSTTKYFGIEVINVSRVSILSVSVSGYVLNSPECICYIISNFNFDYAVDFLKYLYQLEYHWFISENNFGSWYDRPKIITLTLVTNEWRLTRHIYVDESGFLKRDMV